MARRPVQDDAAEDPNAPVECVVIKACVIPDRLVHSQPQNQRAIKNKTVGTELTLHAAPAAELVYSKCVVVKGSKGHARWQAAQKALAKAKGAETKEEAA